jgi:excisionase family DNA binding protein
MGVRFLPWLYQQIFNGKRWGATYLSTTQAAEKMNITAEKVRALCRDGELSGAMRESTNGQWRIPVKAVEKWIDDQSRTDG